MDKSFKEMEALRASDPGLYEELTKEAMRVRSRMKRRGKCSNPMSKTHLCDGDCVGCNYSMDGTDVRIGTDVMECEIPSVYPDQIEQSEIREQCGILMKHITENYGEKYAEAFRLLADGHSGRDVSEALNIPNSTFARKIEEIRAEVREKFDFR